MKVLLELSHGRLDGPIRIIERPDGTRDLQVWMSAEESPDHADDWQDVSWLEIDSDEYESIPLALYDSLASRLAVATARAEKAEQERDEARKNYQFMVDRAADEKLDGYRELGQMAATAENSRDEWRRVALALAAGIGEPSEELRDLSSSILAAAVPSPEGRS